ncbi:MAG: TRAP transporter small permease subunit [Sneathiellaceae bacterium]
MPAPAMSGSGRGGRLGRWHGWLVGGLAWAAAASLVVICVLVLVDVTAYAAGLGSIGWTSDVAAYGLLYSTMLAAPWLVRVKGHVTLESVRRMLPGRVQRVMEILVCVLSILACLMLAWGGVLLIDDSIARAAVDYRVLAIPRWLLYLPLPVGFALMAVEFGRVLAGRDTLYGAGTEGI